MDIGAYLEIRAIRLIRNLQLIYFRILKYLMRKLIIITSLIFLSAGCNPLSKSLPVGVIKSLNGGADWQFANIIKNGNGASLSALSISRLGFDPKAREVVYVGSYTGGLYKSEDSAGSWSNVLSKIYVYDFVISPIDSKIIYAAGSYADHGKVLKTTDGGGSWNQVYNEETVTNPVRAIALNPQNPNQVLIGLAAGNLIKSNDGGITWQLVKNFGDQINRVLWQNNNIYVLVKTKGLFKSGDLGANFTELTASLNQTYSLGGASYNSNTVDAYSQLYVDFTSPSLIYLTSTKNLYKTTNEGQNWNQLNLPVKPTTSLARAVAVAKSSSNIVYTSVGSTVYKSLDGGQSWQTQGLTSGGIINFILIDPQLPQIVYAGIYTTQQ